MGKYAVNSVKRGKDAANARSYRSWRPNLEMAAAFLAVLMPVGNISFRKMAQLAFRLFRFLPSSCAVQTSEASRFCAGALATKTASGVPIARGCFPVVLRPQYAVQSSSAALRAPAHSPSDYFTPFLGRYRDMASGKPVGFLCEGGAQEGAVVVDGAGGEVAKARRRESVGWGGPGPLRVVNCMPDSCALSFMRKTLRGGRGEVARVRSVPVMPSCNAWWEGSHMRCFTESSRLKP